MTYGTRALLLGTAAIAAVVIAPRANAQQTAPQTAPQTAQAAGPGSGLDEIIVTARRREELLQSVPVAITAFTEEDLREKRIQTNSDLAKLVPGYSVREAARGATSGTGTFQAFLRGMPGVRSYFVEVPYPLTGSANFFDLQNIQALVGPQGTLFGLNATGGAILVEPKKPVNEYEGYIEGLVGRYSWREIEGALNIPVVDDKVLVRVAARREVRDGFTEIVSTGAAQDNENSWAWRAAVTVKPTEDIENYFLYAGYWASVFQASNIMQDFNPRGGSALVVGLPAMQAALDRQRELGPRRIQAVNADTNNMEHRHFFADIFSWQITDSVLFKNIAGYRRTTSNSRRDSDSTALPLFGNTNSSIPLIVLNWTRDYSEEAQLQGTLFDGRLNYVAGGFVSYSDIDKAKVQPGTCSFSVGREQCGGASRNDPKSRTQSLFAQGTLDMASLSPSLDGLKFTAGFRYNWDWQSTWNYSVAANGTTCTNALADRNCIQQLGGKFKAPSWTFTLDYQIDPQTLVYATNRRGYSSGGFNPTAAQRAQQTVQPEYNTDVELGAKTEWTLGNVRGRTNLSAFHEWYSNVQRITASVVTNAVGNQVIIALNQNAAKAKIYGVELQGVARFGDAFELSGYYQWLKGKYTKFSSFDSAGNPIDLSNRPFGDLPEHRVSVTGKLFLPIDEALGNASLQATYSYRTKIFIEAGLGTPYDNRPGYGILDLRADWNNVMNSPVDVSVFATNVTDTLYSLGSFPVWTSLGWHGEIWAQPRMYGATIRYRFNQ